MADFSDDYAIVGASGDNFDCDSTGGWGDGGQANAVATSTDRVEGSASLELVAGGSGDAYWYHDVSSGYRFKITEKDLHFWFRYVKGKGDNFLVQNSTAVVIRLYFGGTSKYADYRCTSSGDLELKFGWQLLSASGTNLRGGSTGGGHNGGSDYNLDIYRIELHLNFANSNDTPLNMDCWFVGTTISVTSGTTTTPKTLSDLITYSNTRTAFPLGLVSKLGNLAYIRSGLTIGNGSSGTGNEGHFKFLFNFVLMKQLSQEVKHHLTVKNYSSLVSGEIETGSDGSYYVRGCQIVLPPSMYSDINVENGGTLKLYDSKLYRWRYIYLGGSGDTASTVHLYSVDIDSCECVYFRANTLNLYNTSIHDSTSNNVQQACEFHVSPDTSDLIKLYRNSEALHARETVTVSNCTIGDNSNYDIGVLEGKTLTMHNSVFSSSKLKRLT